MKTRCRLPIAIAALAAAALLAVPATGSAQQITDPAPAPEPPPPEPSPPKPPPPEPAKLHVRVNGDGDGKTTVGKRARVLGRLRPWAPDQRVTVWLERGGRTVKKREVAVTRAKDGRAGRFQLKGPRLIKPGHYRARAAHERSAELQADTARSRDVGIHYPSLDRGSRGPAVKVFNKLLDRRGYVPSSGGAYTPRTGRAVLAFRKVNGMPRITSATSGIFKKLADGRGEYKLRYPGAGQHVEVSIAHQVLALANHGKAVRTYPVSTGKPGTPSDRGHFRFYSRQPGYNSLGMYYSVYYNRGEAIHGYASVPTYPASHGCVREPIPDALSIYNWVRLGMSIYVY